MALAVIRRLTVVGHQHGVAGARVHLRAVPAVEAQHVGSGRTAVNGNDEGIAFPGLITDRLEEHPADHPAVL